MTFNVILFEIDLESSITNVTTIGRECIGVYINE